MKKALIVMAILIAVVASTTFGGVQIASAFNPQPEPPALMPTDVQTFFGLIVEFSGDGGINGGNVGIIIIDNVPIPEGRR